MKTALFRVLLFIGLAMYPASEGLAIDCQDYWTPAYKAMMGCGPSAPAQPSNPVYNGPSPEQIAAQQAAAQAAAEEAKRQAIHRAAQAANDAGLSFWNRHEWGAAVESFRKALARAPGDKVVRSNLEKATEKLQEEQREQQRQQEDSNKAAQMSATLHRMTVAMPDFDGVNSGSAAPATGLDFMPSGGNQAPVADPASQSVGNPSAPSSTAWQDPNVVDLRGTTRTSVDPSRVKGNAPASPGAPGAELPFMSADSATTASSNQGAVTDAGVVDLRGTTKTAIDPASVKGNAADRPAGFRKDAPPPPAPGVQLPQDQDMKLLSTLPPSPKTAWPGPQRPANQPRLVNPLDEEERTKEQTKAVFENPAMEDLMLKPIMDAAIAGVGKDTPAPASKTSETAVNGLPSDQAAGPHN